MHPSLQDEIRSRTGGVGYEGGIITAEIFAEQNHRKFISVLAKGSWAESAASWLRGKSYIDLSEAARYADGYQELLSTILGMRPGDSMKPLAGIIFITIVLAGCTSKPRLIEPGVRIWHVYYLWMNIYDEDDGLWRIQPFPDDAMPGYFLHVVQDDEGNEVGYYDPAAYQKAFQTGVDQDPPIKHLFLKDPERWIHQEYNLKQK